MFALLGLVFPFIKGFLGDGLVEKYLNHKRAQAETASAERRTNIEADIKVLEFEVKRRDTIKELQLKEYEHPFLWWPKFLIMMSVGLYWFAVFMHTTLGLGDFGIVIPELTPAQDAVSIMVLTYMFLGQKIERLFSK
jgi:hypothetical protein